MQVDRLVVAATVGGRTRGPYLVLRGAPVVVGRAAAQGLTLPESWVPRILAILRSSGDGWLVDLGPSGGARVSNGWVRAQFARNATIALPKGKTELVWPIFDRDMSLQLTVEASPGSQLPVLQPEPLAVKPAKFPGTLFGPDHGAREIRLTKRQRHTMAVVFRHLIEGGNRPRNIYGIHDELGLDEAALRQRVRRVRDRVNEGRFNNPLTNIDDLGEYLVEVTGLVTDEDLA